MNKAIKVTSVATAVMVLATLGIAAGAPVIKFRISRCVGNPPADTFMDPYVCSYPCLGWDKSCTITPLGDNLYELFSTDGYHHDCRQEAGRLSWNNLTIGVCNPRVGILLETVPRSVLSVRYWDTQYCYNGDVPPTALEVLPLKTCVGLSRATSVMAVSSSVNQNAYDIYKWEGDYTHTCPGKSAFVLSGIVPNLHNCLDFGYGSSIILNV